MQIQESDVPPKSVRYFYTPSSFGEKLFYYPIRIGHYFCDARYQFNWHCKTTSESKHNQNLMLFIIKRGSLKLNINGKLGRGECGQVVLFYCRNPYEYEVLDDVEFYWLLFHSAQSRQFYEMILQNHNNEQVFPAADIKELYLLFSTLLTECSLPRRMPEYIYSQRIYQILCQLLLINHSQTDSLKGWIKKSIIFIEENFIRSFRNKVGMSPNTFQHSPI